MSQPSSQNNLAVVIMAGGAGTRFWPVSTEERPKQFLKLTGDRTLLQQCHDRVRDLVPPERVLVLTNERFASLVRNQLPDLPQENVVCEPCRRDTAAAVALGAVLADRLFQNPVMAVLPSDHVIEPLGQFHETLLSAAAGAAASPALYTFGIRPTRPETGYGYLERGEPVAGAPGHYRLVQFREKPDLATAQGYVAAERFLWNSGMFVWQASAIMAQVRSLLPEHATRLTTAAQHFGSPRWEDALSEAFEPLERVSIDFGVMEKAPDVRMVESAFSWSDVGGWQALAAYMARDEEGNAAKGRLAVHDSRDNLVFAEDPSETVALVGVRDLVVVRAGKNTLIVPRERAEEVKKLVEKLGE